VTEFCDTVGGWAFPTVIGESKSVSRLKIEADELLNLGERDSYRIDYSRFQNIPKIPVTA